jgi:hypothetical protein
LPKPLKNNTNELFNLFEKIRIFTGND